MIAEGKQAYLIFDLGQLQVYTIQDQIYGGAVPSWSPGMPYDNCYWRDPGSPQGYGPFKHITAAVEHYKWLITTSRGVKQVEKPVAPILRLDFKSKKRVITDL